MIDITTKILLGLIALGLFANAANLVVRPVLADKDYSSQLDIFSNQLDNSISKLANIKDVVVSIGLGTCANNKICRGN